MNNTILQFIKEKPQEKTVYKRTCPKCNKEIIYGQRRYLDVATRYNKKCRFCMNVGKKHTDEWKKKTSIIHKGNKYCLGRKMPNEEKLKRSLSCIGKNKGKIPWSKGLTKETNKILKQMSLSKKGKNNPFYGKIHTKETKKKLSETLKLSWQNPEIKKKWINTLSKSKWLKVRCDIGQLEFLNKWNRLGFNFIPNYQIHTDVDLFYVDGYDHIHNVIIEYDGKSGYHKNLQQKDLIRQQKIINILKPKKFWRYDATNKQIKNVLEN